MGHTTIYINLLAVICLLLSLMKNKGKTVQALRIAIRSFWRLLPTVLFVLLFVALMMGFLNERLVSRWLGDVHNGLSLLIAALLGAVLHIPSLVSFPLAASLIEKGASITVIATFITTLTMIGFVTLPLEIKELGKRFALWRNGLSLVISIVIGLLIGVLV